MTKNAEHFLKKILGGDFLESFNTSLSKSEIYRAGTRTVTDLNDVWQGLMIVPKVLMRLLIQELTPMQVGQIKKIPLPVENTILDVQRMERDSFSGQIFQNNRKINEFQYRSIPGLGLVILSTLELYEVEKMDKEPKIEESLDQKINKLIDDRMSIHNLINQVVDGKLAQKDAINQMMIARLISESKKEEESKEEAKPTIINLKIKKKSPVQVFVEKRKNKKEHFIKMEKSESINCNDCGQTIFNDNGISACLCHGDSKKIHMKKAEGGIKVSFGRNWDSENIEMLLETLRRKNESSR